jgi:hypothetical protein
MQSYYLEVKKTDFPSNYFWERGWHCSMCFAKSQQGALLLNTGSQAMEKVIRSGLQEASMSLWDIKGFGSELMDGNQYLVFPL